MPLTSVMGRDVTYGDSNRKIREVRGCISVVKCENV